MNLSCIPSKEVGAKQMNRFDKLKDSSYPLQAKNLASSFKVS